jgi:hypothetical protein
VGIVLSNPARACALYLLALRLSTLSMRANLEGGTSQVCVRPPLIVATSENLQPLVQVSPEYRQRGVCVRN